MTRYANDQQSTLPQNSSLSMNIHSSPSSSSNTTTSVPPSHLPIRLITHNIRYATTSPSPNEKPWSTRRPKLCAQLLFNTTGHDSPFICLQEALYAQVQNIHASLGGPWTYVGRGRNDDPKDGEFSPIFYRGDTWTCVNWETRWLSETPDVPSIGWDAGQNRIVTMGLFTHKATGLTIVVMATHFDNEGSKARQQSAKLLLKLASTWSQSHSPKPSTVLLGGDFNSPPDDQAYKTMTAKNSGMSDVSNLLPSSKHHGNTDTFTGFREIFTQHKRIDFLFIKEPRVATVKTFGVMPNRFDDGVFLSDHRAVVADLHVPI